MLELFIRIVNGQPFEHPILGDNFRQAFPDVDVNNLPPEFARFIRVPKPNHSRFEKASVSYGWNGNVVTDIWTIEPMSAVEIEALVMQEKAAAIQLLENRIQTCTEKMTEISDPAQVAVWEACRDAHSEWVFESINPITPPFPRFPVKDENGNWVAAP